MIVFNSHIGDRNAPNEPGNPTNIPGINQASQVHDDVFYVVISKSFSDHKLHKSGLYLL